MYIQIHNIQDLIVRFPIVTLLLGLLIWLFGWKIYRIFVVVAGALVGAFLVQSYTWSLGQWEQLLITIAGGVVGALLAFFVLYAGIFLVGLYVGSEVSAYYLSSANYAINLIIGAVVGILFIVLFKFMIILMTSFSGSYVAISSLLNITDLWINEVVFQLLVLAATVLGIFYQYKLWGEPPDHRELESGNKSEK